MFYFQVINTLCKQGGIAIPTPEYVFARPRRWRFDFAWIEKKIALEVEGGVFCNGRHVRGKGFINDMEKYNNAVFLGWRVLRYTPDQIFKGEFFCKELRKILK